MRNNKDTGALGEQIALEFLSKKGYKLIARNYRRTWGEIDLILEKQGIVHFVEVKAVLRSSRNISREMSYQPEELAHSTKLKKVARTAVLYMDANKDDREFQIDVVGVILDEGTRRAECRLFEQVLE